MATKLMQGQYKCKVQMNVCVCLVEENDMILSGKFICENEEQERMFE